MASVRDLGSRIDTPLDPLTLGPVPEGLAADGNACRTCNNAGGNNAPALGNAGSGALA